MKHKLFLCMTALLLALTSIVAEASVTFSAEIPVFWLKEPAMAGTEIIRLGVDPLPKYMRVNLFAGTEILAETAQWKEKSIIFRLNRALRAEETITLFADGTDETDRAFSLRLSWKVSLDGELDLQTNALEALLSQTDIPGNGACCRIPASLDHLGPLKELPLFAPAIACEQLKEMIVCRPLEASFRWTLQLYAENRLLMSCNAALDDTGIAIRLPKTQWDKADYCGLCLNPKGTQGVAPLEFLFDTSAPEKGCRMVRLLSFARSRFSGCMFFETDKVVCELCFASDGYPPLVAVYNHEGKITQISRFYPSPDNTKSSAVTFSASDELGQKQRTLDKSMLKGVELVP